MKIKAAAIAAILVASVAGLFAQSVTVTEKKTVYTRPKTADKFKNQFTITYPKVRASTSAISRKIENALSYKTLFDLDLNEELHGVQWLHEASFEVEYNKNGILGVMLFVEGSGAYPSGTTKRVLIDTRTGNVLRPGDLFTNLRGLTAMVRKVQRSEIEAAIVELKKDPENADIEDTFKESARYHPLKLDQITITDKGVTFHHDYDFAHVIKALEPDGEYSFTWAQLRPYLKKGGLLTRIAH
jgi:hypothetical protein